MVMPTYSAVPSFAELPQPAEEVKEEFEKDEHYLRLVTREDKVTSFFKFDRKTNFKPRLFNSMGVLELEETLTLFAASLSAISSLR